MKKLKIKRKGFGFELVVEGEITIDESKIKDYNDYVRDEKTKLLKEELSKYLTTIMKSSDDSKIGMFTDFMAMQGAKCARNELIEYLIKDMDIE